MPGSGLAPSFSNRGTGCTQSQLPVGPGDLKLGISSTSLSNGPLSSYCLVSEPQDIYPLSTAPLKLTYEKEEQQVIPPQECCSRAHPATPHPTLPLCRIQREQRICVPAPFMSVTCTSDATSTESFARAESQSLLRNSNSKCCMKISCYDTIISHGPVGVQRRDI